LGFSPDQSCRPTLHLPRRSGGTRAKLPSDLCHNRLQAYSKITALQSPQHCCPTKSSDSCRCHIVLPCGAIQSTTTLDSYA
ncbi:hypothetical protein E2562_034471, partial [Oryza meyeriana var. granulata]